MQPRKEQANIRVQASLGYTYHHLGIAARHVIPNQLQWNI
jgi:hypothetical protein